MNSGPTLKFFGNGLQSSEANDLALMSPSKLSMSTQTPHRRAPLTLGLIAVLVLVCMPTADATPNYQVHAGRLLDEVIVAARIEKCIPEDQHDAAELIRRKAARLNSTPSSADEVEQASVYLENGMLHLSITRYLPGCIETRQHFVAKSRVPDGLPLCSIVWSKKGPGPGSEIPTE